MTGANLAGWGVYGGRVAGAGWVRGGENHPRAGLYNKASVRRSGNVGSSNGWESTAGSTVRKIFGTKSDGNSTVTSGVPIIQKSVTI